MYATSSSASSAPQLPSNLVPHLWTPLVLVLTNLDDLVNTVQDQQLFKINCLTRVLPQTRHLRGRLVLEEVSLDNKEELRTCGPSFPVDPQEALGTLHVLTLHLSVHC